MVPPPSSSTSDPTLGAGRAGQLIAGAGAVLALLGPFAVWLAGCGVLVLVFGTVLAAPVANRPGPYLAGWWTITGVSALVCLVGFGLGFVIGWLGGLLLTAGAVSALVAVGLGSPAGRS